MNAKEEKKKSNMYWCNTTVFSFMGPDCFNNWQSNCSEVFSSLPLNIIRASQTKCQALNNPFRATHSSRSMHTFSINATTQGPSNFPNSWSINAMQIWLLWPSSSWFYRWRRGGEHSVRAGAQQGTQINPQSREESSGLSNSLLTWRSPERQGSCARGTYSSMFCLW